MLGQFEKIRKECEQRARGETGTLAIAFTSAAIWSGILPRLIKKFQAGHPAARFSLRQMRSILQVEALIAGRIDIGFVSTPPHEQGVEYRCMAEEDSLLVVPGGHPLAKRRSIRPEDLNGLKWIFLSEAISFEKQNQFCMACAKLGFVPDIVQNVTEPTTLLAFVETGLGVGIIRGTARKYAPRTLAFKQVPWMPFRNRTFMIHSAAKCGPSLPRLRDICRMPSIFERYQGLTVEPVFDSQGYNFSRRRKLGGKNAIKPLQQQQAAQNFETTF